MKYLFTRFKPVHRINAFNFHQPANKVVKMVQVLDFKVNISRNHPLISFEGNRLHTHLQVFGNCFGDQ